MVHVTKYTQPVTTRQTQHNIMYQEEFEFSLELVKSCGELIKNAFYGEKRVSEKSSATDLVTETDQMVEKMLIEGLREKFPDTRLSPKAKKMQKMNHEVCGALWHP